MNQIKSDSFLIDFHRTRFEKFFGLVRNGLKTDFGMVESASDLFGFNSNPKISPA